ncbi:hypothetical protein psyc5s11_20210 [Clostridium gelidum]|uniref:SCP2 domain-containing protein n=1 Tax=Clostridium gelidum TaxID=704125 RepID=A0ABM7T209_9CLOT|nr:hypothetical protein psyc5s11_20210 [Clostridium gelidum]
MAKVAKTITYEDNFNNFKTILKEVDASEIDGELAFQFNIVGDGEGIFYVKVKDGQLSVEPYEYYDRDAVFIATAKVFTKMAEGKLNPVVAFTTGKLKVEGNLDKARAIEKIVTK